jgi:putative ABC transport system permease protein
VFRTILANISRRKLRLVATGLAVLLGVAFTSGTLVLTDTLGATFDNLFSDVYHGTDAVVRSSTVVKTSLEGAGNGNTRGLVSESYIPQIEKVPGVAAVAGSVSAGGSTGGYAQIVGKNGKALGNPNRGAPTLGGGWVDSPALNPYRLYSGHPPQQAGQVVIDKYSAKQTGYKIGDRFQVLTPTGTVEVTLVGIAKFGTADSAGGASQVLFTMEQAQQVMGTPGKFGEIRVEAKPGVSQEQLVQNISKVLPSTTQTITGKAAAKEQQDLIKQGLSFFSVFLLVFAAVGLVVGAFIIANTFSILVAQRTRELALLRALGASRRQVLVSVVIEAAVVGAIASLLGLGLGVLLSQVLLKVIAGGASTTSAVVKPLTVIVAFGIGIGITVLSALFPARKASKVAPVAAMRDTAVEATSGRPVRAIVGAALLALGIVASLLGAYRHTVGLVGLGAALCLIGAVTFGPVVASFLGRLLGRPARALGGISAQLGEENVLRNPRRTSSTASALMIGVFLVAGISVFAASALASINKVIDNNFKGQFVVESTGNGLPSSLVDKLTHDPRVGTVAGLSYVPVQVGTGGLLAIGTNPKNLPELYNVQVEEGNFTTIGNTGLAVSRRTATNHHWQLGSPVTLTYLNGTKHDFTVKAIFKNQPFRTPMFASDQALAGALPVLQAQIIFVGEKAGQTEAQSRAVLEELTASNPTAKVNNASQFKAEQAAQMATLLRIIYALLAFAVIIAVFGVVNTLGLSILERTRELGLLRAVGMSRKQVRTSIRVEAILIAMTGTVVGLLLGIGLGAAVMRAISNSQSLTSLAFPIPTLVIVFLLGSLVGVLAAILPAWRAARLDPLRALAME